MKTAVKTVDATPEWLQWWLRAPHKLPRTTHGTLSIQVISRAAALATLFFFVTLVNSFGTTAVAPSQHLHENPSAQAIVPAAPESSLPVGAQQEKSYGTVSGRAVDQDSIGIAGIDGRRIRAISN